MTSYLRKVMIQIIYGGSNSVVGPLECHVSLGIDQRISSCTFTTMYLPSGLTYDTVVEVTMGVLGGNAVPRFKGIVRDITYKLKPRSVTILCYGFLKRALEYENIEDPTAIGGRIPMDITSGGITYTQFTP